MVSTKLLKQVGIFSGLADDQLARIASLCREETHRKDDVIVREKEPTTELYIIQDGSAQVILALRVPSEAERGSDYLLVTAVELAGSPARLQAAAITTVD